MKNKHIGSGFNDFLQKEGLLEVASATATKRVISHQIQHFRGVVGTNCKFNRQSVQINSAKKTCQNSQ